MTTDFYIRVLKFEKDPDVTNHKPNQSYTEPIAAVLIPNRKAARNTNTLNSLYLAKMSKVEESTFLIHALSTHA